MDSQSEAWNKVAADVDFTLTPDWKAFEEHVPVTARILDFGCGYGRVARELADRGFKDIVGYDTAEGLIARGRAEAPHLVLRTYRHPALPEADARFDAVLCCAVMTCMPDPEIRGSAMREISRILRPGGVLYMAEFLRSPDRIYDDSGRFHSSLGVHMKHFTQAEILEMAQGFSPLYTAEKPEVSVSGHALPAFHLVCQKPEGTSQIR